MSFTIVHPDPGQVVDCQIKDDETIYVGSIVSTDATPTEGIVPMPAMAGTGNTGFVIPWGVCVGTNNDTPLYNSSWKTEYITDATPHGSSTNFIGVEGPWAKGDKVAMAKIHLIDATTVIKGPLYDGAYGTAPEVLTATAGSGAGTGCTTNANDVQNVSVYSTIYCRSGANAGAYRVPVTASTLTHTWHKPMTSDTAVGDTFVLVNGLRPFGKSKAFFDTEGMYIDINEPLTSKFCYIDVVRLDLSVAGNEYVEFRFNVMNFQALRT